VARAEARGPPLRDPGREGGPVARRRHAWQLGGVEQQFSMGAACLPVCCRGPALASSFRAQWLLGSVHNDASGLGCFLHAHLAREPACSRLRRAPLAVISVPIAPEPSLGVGLGRVLSVECVRVA
jgi:hypothetical protein